MIEDSAKLILQLVISLAVVIGMIWLLVKLLSMRSKWLSRNRPLKVLGGVGLGPQKSVQLVEIGGVIYVLGIGQEVTLLRLIEDPAEQERIREDFNIPQENAVTWLGRHRGKHENPQLENFSSVLNDTLREAKKQREHTLDQWLDEQRRSPEKEKAH